MRMLQRYLALTALLFVAASCGKASEKKDQPTPIVQSSVLQPGWYPTEPNQLTNELKTYFDLAQTYFSTAIDAHAVKALIVPHAGYYFSGLCAATAYQTLINHADKHKKNNHYTRVIILAPSHTSFFNGVSLPSYTVYRTALGDIPVDVETIKALRNHELFRGSSEAHDKEHAIEVQLPFLQHTLTDFSIVPLIVGHLRDDRPFVIAKELKKYIDDRTLIVISSDFVHQGKSFEYQPFSKDIIDMTRYIDSLAVQSLCLQSYSAFETMLKQTGATICGQEALKILLALCEQRALGTTDGHLCCYYTSTHIGRARQENPVVIDIPQLFQPIPDEQAQASVSYVGLVLAKPVHNKLQDLLTGYEKKSLLAMVKNVITNDLTPEADKKPDHLLAPIISTNLDAHVGAFVTLHKQGQLRGCIGNIISPQPLYKTVMSMARAAAFNDTRFSPVASDEINQLAIDITILSQPTHVNSYRDIVLGKHGIILQKYDIQGRMTNSSVFLPQVPLGQGWNLQTTLEQLSLKAGLGRDSWTERCSFDVFEGFEITWNS